MGRGWVLCPGELSPGHLSSAVISLFWPHWMHGALPKAQSVSICPQGDRTAISSRHDFNTYYIQFFSVRKSVLIMDFSSLFFLNQMQFLKTCIYKELLPLPIFNFASENVVIV